MDAKLSPIIRKVEASDLDTIDALEQRCFSNDRLSRRRLKFWIRAEHRIFIVCEVDAQIVGYGLTLLPKGTRHGRLYSLAIDAEHRGAGYARLLIEKLENGTKKAGRLFMRLEVSKQNPKAIALYEGLDYQVFGVYDHYYEDDSDALRMQKRIRSAADAPELEACPWFAQTTPFTCGPAALLMAMARLRPERPLSKQEELDIWREATTIFMTSGHGGTHPIGLALSAKRRGFEAEVLLNSSEALFVDGVRVEAKREVIAMVDAQFREQARNEGVNVNICEASQSMIAECLAKRAVVICLVSTYRLDGHKAPHWVCVTGIDELCLYVHDPDFDQEKQDPFECQHIPIAREDFNKMATFGSRRLRTAIVISLPLE